MPGDSEPTLITRLPSRPVSTAMTEPPAGSDNYLIGREIARGGMGSILEAEDTKLKRTVAVKVMLLDADADNGMRQRFLREAEVLALLAHPNIVPIHDIVWESGVPLFYSMKLVKGRTLQAILAELRMRNPDALRDYAFDRLLLILRKVCDALAFAHSKGVLHRDLKPENIMVGEFGEVLVMDWGLAKVKDGANGDNAQCPVASSQSGTGGEASWPVHCTLRTEHSDPLRTLAGAVMGTPQFMSPEQAMGQIEELDERSDIYSLGCILYAILTLRPPVEGKTLDEMLHKVITAQITAPSDVVLGTRDQRAAHVKGTVLDARLIKPLPHMPGGRVPSALSSVAMKALALDTAKRYQSVAELSADIEAYQGGFATQAEHAGAWKQLKLLMLRQKTVTMSGLLILLLSIGFVFKLVASEGRALANENRALLKEHETRRALARSHVSLAEAAFRGADVGAMTHALDSVPPDLRDQDWGYFSAKRDASYCSIPWPNKASLTAVAAIPRQTGAFMVATEQGQVLRYDAYTGNITETCKTRMKGALRLGIAPDGMRFAVAAAHAPILQIYRLSDGKLEQELPAPSSALALLVFSPDGNLLAASDFPGGPGNRSTLLDLRSGKHLWQVRPAHDSIVFSPEGAKLFVGGGGVTREFRVLAVNDGRVLKRTRGYTHSMAMSPDKTQIAVGLHDGVVILFDAATGDELRRGKLHDGEVSNMAWTSGGHLLTLGSKGGFENLARGRRVIQLCETSNFANRGLFFGLKAEERVPFMAYDPGSGCLVTLGSSPRLWHLGIDVEAARIAQWSEQGWSVAFLSDSVLFARKRFQLCRYDVSRPQEPRPLPSPEERSHTLAAVHHAASLLITASRINQEDRQGLRIYDTAGPELVAKTFVPTPGRVITLDIDLQGERVLAVTEQQRLQIFAIGTATPLLKISHPMTKAVFAGVRGNVVAIAGHSIVGDAADALTLFDATNGSILRSVPQHLRLNALVTSPDRRRIAIAGAEQIVRVLDADTLEETHRFRAHDAVITALCFHPTLPVIASASPDGSVKLWRYDEHRLERTYLGIEGTPVAIAFSPNGRLLALEGQQHATRIFDLQARVPSTHPAGSGAPNH